MKSWILSGVSITWLPPVPGCALREARINGERVFGQELAGPRVLVWADEKTIKAVISSGAKNAKARLANEVRKLGESLPAMLPSISGLGHESMIDGTAIEMDQTGKPGVPKTRKIGFENDGSKVVDVSTTDREVTP